MTIDFSNLNLQYLIRARDIAKKRPELAAAILGLPLELVNLLASLTAEGLTKLSRIKAPLLTLRGDAGWWARLLNALKDQRDDEIDAVLDHASLVLLVDA